MNTVCFDFKYLGSEHEGGVYLLNNILTLKMNTK